MLDHPRQPQFHGQIPWSSEEYRAFQQYEYVFKRTGNTKCWWACGSVWTPLCCLWEWKMVQLCWKTVWWILTKLRVILPYSPVITPCGIYPIELKIYIHTKIYTQMLIATLFIIIKNWKQLRYLSKGKWKNKLWYAHIIEYYSAIEKWALKAQKDTKELKLHIATWKKSIWKNYILCDFCLCTNSGKSKTMKISGPQGPRGEGWDKQVKHMGRSGWWNHLYVVTAGTYYALRSHRT